MTAGPFTQDCYWLPPPPAGFEDAVSALASDPAAPLQKLNTLRSLSKHRLDLIQNRQLYQNLQKIVAATGFNVPRFISLKLALLSSSTTEHLLAALHVACLRRSILLEVYTGHFNQYQQEILDAESGLYRFKPDVVCLALDVGEVSLTLPWSATAADADAAVDQIVQKWTLLWQRVQASGAAMIHQNLVIPPHRFLGEIDARTPAAPQFAWSRLNQAAGAAALKNKVLWIDLDNTAARVGKEVWCDWPLWHHAKQAVSPAFAPLYGDILARVLGAIRGRSQKCLVLDLDNTLWGGVLGDDGLEHLELGQGSGVGEAFLAFQNHVKRLHERGVLLAVCSKNDSAAARKAFENHPEMKLRLNDVSSFVANWDDKATNLRTIAKELNIGLDALVFFDDNPAERAWVRQSLPEVAVPEVPEDPAWFASCLSDAGYFESTGLTPDDLKRTEQYAANKRRAEDQQAAGDMESFLKGLQMEMAISPFDDAGRTRITQLINKSNQFNLTTRRYTENQIEQMQKDPDLLTYQVRLKDSFGDNGMISVLILRPVTTGGVKGYGIDTWLMSCRVLGRRVEHAVLNVLAQQARKRGAQFLQGEFIPTEKNGLVADHYKNLGFEALPPGAGNSTSSSFWRLSLAPYKELAAPIRIQLSERNDHVNA